MSETPLETETPMRSVQPDGDEGAFVEVSELLHTDAGNVSATHVSIEQATIGSIQAQRVEIEQSAIRTVSGHEIQMEQSATAMLKGDDTAIHDSAAGVVSANRIDLFGSTIGIVRGPVTVAGDAPSRILVQIGGGENRPRPLLDGQSALTLGAGAGLAVIVFGRALRRILGS